MERGGGGGGGGGALYLASTGELVEYDPARKARPGFTRVLCISDTHLVHGQMHLPCEGVHLLVHAGDIMTESLLRHVSDGEPKNSGVALFEAFAQWLCAVPIPFKVLIAGNHDGTLEAMGAERVREVLSKHPSGGGVAYLVHQTASVGRVKVFGSPFGRWGSHNNAFSAEKKHNLHQALEANTHVVVTHSPPVLPGKEGPDEHEALVDAIVSSGALLSVSGHCHWAYGVQRCRANPQLPFVVASSCSSGWKTAFTQKGERLDYWWDKTRGGYNVENLPIIVDIEVEPPKERVDKWVFHK